MKKEEIPGSIRDREEKILKLSDDIWEYAETKFEEYKSASRYCELFEAEGFRVTKGIADMETAFVGEFGRGKPIVNFLYPHLQPMGIFAASTDVGDGAFPQGSGARREGHGPNRSGPLHGSGAAGGGTGGIREKDGREEICISYSSGCEAVAQEVRRADPLSAKGLNTAIPCHGTIFQ